MPIIIAPSILAADFANIERDVNMINESTADWFHVDIMDGVLSENLEKRLKKNKVAGKTLTLKIKYSDLRKIKPS